MSGACLIQIRWVSDGEFIDFLSFPVLMRYRGNCESNKEIQLELGI